MSFNRKRKKNSRNSTEFNYDSGISFKNYTRFRSKTLSSFKFCKLQRQDSQSLLRRCDCKVCCNVVEQKSKECMCEMCDLEKELTIFFYNEIMNQFLTDYQIPVEEEPCIRTFVRRPYGNVSADVDSDDSAKADAKVFFAELPPNPDRDTKDTSSEGAKVTIVFEKLPTPERRSDASETSISRRRSNASETLPLRRRESMESTKSGGLQASTPKNKKKVNRYEMLNKSTERRRSSQDMKAATLQPITEDNTEAATEKLISTTNFEYDWLVKRDEKYAKITFDNGNVYEGDVADKVPHGKGTFWWADGTVYEGDFEDGAPTGKGSMQLPDLTEYIGTFYKGYFHGNGVYNIRSTNMVYSGGWKYGRKHGEGWLLYEPGVWYEGEFINDLRHGKGFFQFGNGICYEGSYIRNQREGNGAMRWSNNDIYIGQWSEGVIDGYGEYSWKTVFNNTFLFPVQNYYKGSWVKGKRTGTGVLFFGTENGSKMAGVFQDNFKHGAAVVVCGNGRSIEKNPLFLNDKPIHMSVSVEEMLKESSSAIFNHKLFQSIAKTGITERQWPTKSHPSQVTSQLLENAKQERGALCNPIEIQIHSPPEDIELIFYIEKALGMYVNAFDTIQFDLESNESSSSSNASKIQLSKWNLMTLNSGQPSKAVKSAIQETPILFGRCSVSQGGTPFHNKSDSKFQSTLRSEEKYLRNVIIRHLPKLMEIYYHYATITSPTKVYFKHYMIRMFLWQMYLDIGITKMGISLVEIDTLLDENPASYVESCHHPFEHIYFFQFIQSLMGTALLVHYQSREEVHSSEGLTPYIFQKFLLELLFIHVGSHQGRSLFEFKDVLPIKNVYSLYLKLGEPHSARTFLNNVCTRKGEEPPCYKAWTEKDSAKTCYLGSNVNAVGHNFLYIPEKEEIGELPEEPINELEETDPFFQDLTTFRILGPKIVVQCLYTICPPILQNGVICNMDYQLTFLEFYEVLICCALLTIAKTKKRKEFLRKLNEEPRVDDNADQDTISRKGSAKLRKRK